MRGLRQLTAVTGIVAFALIAVAFAGGTPPAMDDNGRVVLAYAADHRTFLLTFFFVDGIATSLILVFFAGLRRLLATPDRPGNDVWSSVMFGSAIALFTLGIAAQACATAVAFRADTETPDTARTLWDLYVVLIAASNLLTIPLGVAAAIAILTSDTLPRWLGWLAGVFALTHLGATLSWARSGAFSQTGIFSVVAGLSFLLWMLATAIVLLRRTDAPAGDR